MISRSSFLLICAFLLILSCKRKNEIAGSNKSGQVASIEISTRFFSNGMLPVDPSSLNRSLIRLRWQKPGEDFPISENTTPQISEKAFYKFEYDEQGRIRKINDKEFFYNSMNRVDYTRIHQIVASSYGEATYIERLSYHWDQQGRLKLVLIDSSYRKTPTPVGGLTDYNIMLRTNVPHMEYEYKGNSRFPSAIKYKDDYNAQHTIHFEYEGGNVVQETTEGSYTSIMPGIGIHMYSPYTGSIFNRYTNAPNFLAKAYEQLRFHPLHLNEVVSYKLIERSYSVLHENNTPIKPDWRKAQIYRTEYNQYGYPTLITSVAPEDVFTGKEETTRITYY